MTGLTRRPKWVEYENQIEDMESRIETLRNQRDEMLAILIDLQESASYWSEYDVPLGIVERINEAVRKATT
jgi:hypothetical protein